MRHPQSILLTGASGGIGGALARAYAGPGVLLFLGGRDAERLEAVAAACREAGAEVETATGDVTDAAAMADWVGRADRHRPLDLLIANAGTSAGTGFAGEDEVQTRRILAVNLDGVINTVMPAIPRMQARQRGQIAVMSSLAAFRGFPGAPAYCASKAAVKTWGEALRGFLHRDGVAVSVICPGFVRTAMTSVNRFPMPFLIDADRAAAIIRRGLAADRARIVFPWRAYTLLRVVAALPPGLTDPFLRRLPAKE